VYLVEGPGECIEPVTADYIHINENRTLLLYDYLDGERDVICIINEDAWKSARFEKVVEVDGKLEWVPGSLSRLKAED
jgi:hypothetical protein